MAEAAEINTTAPPPRQGRPGDLPPWSEVWQIPILLVGLSLFIVGLYLAIPTPKKDDFPGALDSAVQYMQANNFPDAQTKLSEIAGRIELAPPNLQAKHAQLWGDLIYFQMEADPGRFETSENRKKVHNWYTKSKELGQSFDGLHLQRWADTLVMLDRREDALKIIDQLKDQPPERRYLILRRLIEQRVKNPQTVNNDELAALMAQFLQDVGQETVATKRRTQELWASQWQARMALASNPQGTIDLLLRKMIYFKDQGGDKDLPPLMVILAKAYQRSGELGEARRWFRAAQQRLQATDKLTAEVLVGLAQIDMADAGSARSSDGSDLRTAMENFARAESEYPTSPAYIDAIVGRADCEARIGAHTESMEHFGRAVKRVMEETPRDASHVQHIIDTVRGHFSTQSDQGNFNQALEYLGLIVPLYAGQQDLPADVLLQFATTHERLGKLQQQRALTVAAKQASEAAEVNTAATTTQPAAADPQRRVALQEAAIQFSKAADYYLRHARTMALSDDAAFGGSLWKASSCYLEARQWKKAIEVYAEFVRTRPGDPRQLQALAQLGLAYQADDQPGAAVAFYEQLVTEHPNTPEAYDTLVPMARCYVALNQYDNAKRTLLYVLTDHPAITPDSNTYRQALVEIGKLHYQLKEFEPAIEALHKAVLREKKSPLLPSLRFLLADSYRQSVIELIKSMDDTLPQTKRLALQAERTRRLEQALTLFGQVIADFELQEQSNLSPLEKLYLRNAYFYRGDAAYDLGRFEQSITLYDQAANRWRGHPASMVALVQIVNAYCQLGQIQEAKVANDRAREQLKRIPDDAFNDPSLPMTRQHWQDWLKWTSDMNLFASNPGKPATKPR